MSDKFWVTVINPNLYVHDFGLNISTRPAFDVKKTLKFFLYLNDVTTTNGGFFCIPKSNKESERFAKYMSKFLMKMTFDQTYFKMKSNTN